VTVKGKTTLVQASTQNLLKGTSIELNGKALP
jgi:hypothetical protein